MNMNITKEEIKKLFQDWDNEYIFKDDIGNECRIRTYHKKAILQFAPAVCRYNFYTYTFNGEDALDQALDYMHSICPIVKAA